MKKGGWIHKEIVAGIKKKNTRGINKVIWGGILQQFFGEIPKKNQKITEKHR